MPGKVLVVSNAYPSDAAPSYGAFVHRCVEALLARGSEVEVIGLSQRTALLPKFLGYLVFAARANVALACGNYQCVYIHYPVHSLLAALPGLLLRRHRLVLNFHGDDLVPVKPRQRLLKRLASPMFKGDAAVLVPSNHFKQLFDAEFPARPGGGAVVFCSGGVASTYLNGEAPPLQARGRSALFLSRWVDGKGWHAFLALARSLLQAFPDFRFTLAGGGPDEVKIRRAIADHGLTDVMAIVPSCTEADNQALYRSHRYFVFPSHLDESLGLVNLEAMACGCVVLSSNFSAANDYLVHGESGFTLSLGGFAEQARRIIAMLEADPPLGEKVAFRARAVAADMSQTRAGEELSSLLGLG